jgi:hypothetical protein
LDGKKEMNREVAEYVLALRDAAGATRQAEDRPIYAKLLADAGVILALVDTGADPTIIADAATAHERLWGHTWLQDPVFEVPSKAWQEARNRIEG